MKQKTKVITYFSFKLETKLKSMMSPIVTRAPAFEAPKTQLAKVLKTSMQMNMTW